MWSPTQGQLHRHQAAVGQQVGAEREDGRGQRHRPGPVELPGPARGDEQAEEPDPEAPILDDGEKFLK